MFCIMITSVITSQCDGKFGKSAISYCIFIHLLSGVPDLWDRNKILRDGDLSHLHVPDCTCCIWVLFYFVCFVFIHHNFQFYFESYTYCNILDIYLL